MTYKLNGNQPRSKKRLILLLLVLVLTVLYSLQVYCWWIEGNLNFERQRAETQNESIIPRH